MPEIKKFLPKLVSETQSVFLAGRQISNNTLLAQEAFHALNTNTTGTRDYMAIKTDTSKAYDRVEWFCVERLCERWVLLNRGSHGLWFA